MCNVKIEDGRPPADKTKFSDCFRSVFGVDLTADKDTVHPPFVCDKHRRLMQRLQASPSSTNIEIFVFKPHTDGDCTVCQPTEDDEALKPKRKSAGGPGRGRKGIMFLMPTTLTEKADEPPYASTSSQEPQQMSSPMEDILMEEIPSASTEDTPSTCTSMEETTPTSTSSMYYCQPCDRYFDSKPQLDKHNEAGRHFCMNASGVYTCRYCGKNVESFGGVIFHESVCGKSGTTPGDHLADEVEEEEEEEENQDMDDESISGDEQEESSVEQNADDVDESEESLDDSGSDEDDDEMARNSTESDESDNEHPESGQEEGCLSDDEHPEDGQEKGRLSDDEHPESRQAESRLSDDEHLESGQEESRLSDDQENIVSGLERTDSMGSSHDDDQKCKDEGQLSDDQENIVSGLERTDSMAGSRDNDQKSEEDDKISKSVRSMPRCRLCAVDFRTSEMLDEHMAYGVHKNQHGLFTCRYCQKLYKEHGRFVKHRNKLCDKRPNKDAEQPTKRNPTTSPNYCQICRETFTERNYGRHMKEGLHKNEKGKYTCSVCQRLFPILGSLKAHLPSCCQGENPQHKPTRKAAGADLEEGKA